MYPKNSDDRGLLEQNAAASASSHDNAGESRLDIPALANEINECYYLQDFNPDTHKEDLRSGNITRINHGATHANRVAILVRVIVNLYRKLGQPEALLLNENDIELLQLVALCHDAKRQTDLQDLWEYESRQVLERKLIYLGIDPEKAYRFARIITQKEKAGILGRIFQSAVSLDIMRYKKKLKLERVSLYQEFKDVPSACKQIQELALQVRQLISAQNDLTHPCQITQEGKLLFDAVAVTATRDNSRPELKEAYEFSPNTYLKIRDDLSLAPFQILNSLFNQDSLIEVEHTPPKVVSIDTLNIEFNCLLKSLVPSPDKVLLAFNEFAQRHLGKTIGEFEPVPALVNYENLQHIPAIRIALLEYYANFTEQAEDLESTDNAGHFIFFKEEQSAKAFLDFIKLCLGDEFTEELKLAYIVKDSNFNQYRFMLSVSQHDALRHWHWRLQFPEQDYVLMKSLRADERCFVEEFFSGVTGGQQAAVRPGPKGDFTVKGRGKGIYSRVDKTPEYTPQEKAGFSQIQSTTIVTADAWSPPFGLRRGADKLVGMTLPAKDALLNRLFLYDGGTVDRIYDFATREEAEQYYREKVTGDERKLFPTLSLFMAEIARQSKGYNETMARLRWSQAGRLTIFYGNLASRLLAQGYAVLLKQQLQERVDVNDEHFSWYNASYEVPISFYDNKSLRSLTAYSHRQQKEDKQAAFALIDNDEELTSWINHCNYEFLLALENPADQHKLTALLQKPVSVSQNNHAKVPLHAKILNDGYEHILLILQAKGFQLPIFEEQAWKNILPHCPELIYHVARRSKEKAQWLFKCYGKFIPVKFANEMNVLHKCFQSLRNDLLAFFIGQDGFSIDLDVADNYGNTALHLAAQSGLTSVVIQLIKRGVNIQAKNKAGYGYSPIEMAAAKGHWGCVLAFASSKKDGTDKANYGGALLAAVRANRLDVVKALLKAKASTSWHSTDKNSVLHHAVLIDNPEMIALLIKHGADITRKNKDGKAPIEIAAEKGHWDCVLALASSKKDKYGHANYSAALVDAVCANRLDVVKALLKAKAPTRSNTIPDVNGVLHHAVLIDNPEMIALLIKHGADIAMGNKDRKTPIQVAAAKGHWDCVLAFANNKDDNYDKYGNAYYGYALLTAVQANRLDVVKALLKAKASTTWHTNPNENGVLHHAVLIDNPEMIALLIKHGADTTKKNKAGQTPIQVAAAKGHWDCVLAFANNKKDENHKANYGAALLTAVLANRLDAVKALLKAKAGTSWCTTPDENGVLHHAVLIDNPEMIPLLIKHGADTTWKNKDGQTPNDMATSMVFCECANVLNVSNDITFNNPQVMINQNNSAAIICELLMMSEKNISEHWISKLAKQQGVKEKILDHIGTLPEHNQKTIIKTALDESTHMGKFFLVQRGLFKPNLARGTLAKLAQKNLELSNRGDGLQVETLNHSGIDLT